MFFFLNTVYSTVTFTMNTLEFSPWTMSENLWTLDCYTELRSIIWRYAAPYSKWNLCTYWGV